MGCSATANDFGPAFYETRRQTPGDVLYQVGRVVDDSSQSERELIKDHHGDRNSTQSNSNAEGSTSVIGPVISASFTIISVTQAVLIMIFLQLPTIIFLLPQRSIFHALNVDPSGATDDRASGIIRVTFITRP